MTYPVLPGNDLTAGQDNLFEDPKGKSSRGLPRRSKSAGQSPLHRVRGLEQRVTASPVRPLGWSPHLQEVIKHGVKPRRDQPLMSEVLKVDDMAVKNGSSRFPLRRAGLDNSRKLNFFKKPAELPCRAETAAQPSERAEGDALMIDVESIIAAEEIRKQAAAVEQIRDVGMKWLSGHPPAQKNAIEQLAVNFLLTMNSTLCFFTVAMRMLAKAPWTDAMIWLDVRQAAIVAISRGWYAKCEDFGKYPFTRAELALAAGAYQGLLTPTIPDDTTVALRTIIDHLPPTCNSLFTQAEVACPFCHAKKDGIVRTFSSSISWEDAGWVDLKSALARAQPFLGYLPRGWHQNGCSRDDQCPTVTKLGKWLYLELRPYPWRDGFFPFLSESVPFFCDSSLNADGLCVDSLVCSNLKAGTGRHYWLVELMGGRIQHAYDSLQGVQSLTQEVYRTLQVTGILRKVDCGSKPCLRNQKLDQIAGKVDTVQRRSQTIKVPSRSRTCKMRKQLVKSMSKLSFAPTNINLPSKEERGGDDDLITFVRQPFHRLAPESHNASLGIKKSKAPRGSKAKCRAKGKARPKPIAKNKLGIVAKHCVAPQMVVPWVKWSHTSALRGMDSMDNNQSAVLHSCNEALDLKRNVGEAGCPQFPHSKNEVMNSVVKGDGANRNADDSDPISDSTPQADESASSPPRVRKRSFAHAILGEVFHCDGTSEDDLRRKLGPPKTVQIAREDAALCAPPSDVEPRVAQSPKGDIGALPLS